MTSYTLAASQKRLPDLIDRALAGEQVIITREGAPPVELHVAESKAVANKVREATTRLEARLDGKPLLVIPVESFREWLYQDYPY